MKHFYFTEKLLFFWKINVLDTGKKNNSTGQKNYSTWRLICRLKETGGSQALFFVPTKPVIVF